MSFYFENLNYDPVGKRLTIEFLGDPQILLWYVS